MKAYIKRTWRFYPTAERERDTPPPKKENTTQKQTPKTSIDAKGALGAKDPLLHAQTRLEAYLLSTPAPLTVFQSPCRFPFPAHEADFRSPN